MLSDSQTEYLVDSEEPTEALAEIETRPPPGSRRALAGEEPTEALAEIETIRSLTGDEMDFCEEPTEALAEIETQRPSSRVAVLPDVRNQPKL